MLDGHRIRIDGSGPAREYAAHLLASLGAESVRGEGPEDLPDACAWARSGAMWLTGEPDGPPRLAPGPLASCARGAIEALGALQGSRPALPRDPEALLGERAADFGYTRRGRIAPSGSCRLLRSADGWIALNLARDDDRASLPAWLECDVPAASEDPWDVATRGVLQRSTAELLERAAWLGLPAAAAAPPPAVTPPWLRWSSLGERRRDGEPPRSPLVVDFSSLWAGPLATHLLHACGWHVWKVESATRPDGARFGPIRFFDRLNRCKSHARLDLRLPRHRGLLFQLARRADCLVESSRPRALAQLGLDPRAWLAERRGRSWLSITGYGRDDPAPGRVAFGDDAAVAAGLAHATGGADGPLFCGDAIADPLAGLHAALALAASQQAGGGHLIDVSLHDVTAHAAGFVPARREPARVLADGDGFVVECAGRREPVARPRASRRPAVRARSLGVHHPSLIRELFRRC
jgi:crotonobetainyl-CoA:carnitine CoA-transferase CaiB-like acyl-CoA transferase